MVNAPSLRENEKKKKPEATCLVLLYIFLLFYNTRTI
jgi:hypothetical protein